MMNRKESELLDWIMKHPEEARGINITMDGKTLTDMLKMMLEWCKEEYKKAQMPAMMTTKEAQAYFHITDRYLRMLAAEGKIEKVYNGRTNLYYKAQISSILERKKPQGFFGAN